MLGFFKRSDPNTTEFIKAKEWFRETYIPKLHSQYALAAKKMSPGRNRHNIIIKLNGNISMYNSAIQPESNYEKNKENKEKLIKFYKEHIGLTTEQIKYFEESMLEKFRQIFEKITQKFKDIHQESSYGYVLAMDGLALIESLNILKQNDDEDTNYTKTYLINDIQTTFNALLRDFHVKEMMPAFIEIMPELEEIKLGEKIDIFTMRDSTRRLLPTIGLKGTKEKRAYIEKHNELVDRLNKHILSENTIENPNVVKALRAQIKDMHITLYPEKYEQHLLRPPKSLLSKYLLEKEIQTEGMQLLNAKAAKTAAPEPVALEAPAEEVEAIDPEQVELTEEWTEQATQAPVAEEAEAEKAIGGNRKSNKRRKSINKRRKSIKKRRKSIKKRRKSNRRR
jgi:hypothetical protein